jgi:excinuclease UvrABC nuclease subunit
MQPLEFIPEQDSALFASVPAAPAVFLLRGVDADSEPYISKTANLRRRLQRLLSAPAERTRRLNLRQRVRWIEYSPTGSDFESGLLLYQLLRTAFPKTYAARLRFRPAPLVKLHLENAYPRATITTRLGRARSRSLYYGPFATRTAAEKFLHDSLDFFKMRRCVEDLHPDPKFPGCVYSEMKMCLAPCFQGCTDGEYRNEVARVQSYLDSGGDSLVREIAQARDAASANLEFESAATLHTRFEKLKPVTGLLPELVRRLDQLSGLIVQTSAELGCVALFRLQAAQLSKPLHFPIQAAEHAKSQSMEARVQACLAAAPVVQPHSAIETMEHLAFLKRWYYRSTRKGEIFLADAKGQLPLRRIVRGIGRVFRGEKPEVVVTNPFTAETERPEENPKQ